MQREFLISALVTLFVVVGAALIGGWLLATLWMR